MKSEAGIIKDACFLFVWIFDKMAEKGIDKRNMFVIYLHYRSHYR